MEFDGLSLSNVAYVGNSGIILSPEQKAALENSLIILKNENRFHKVYLWGKIEGTKDDYFIAQGVGRDEFDGKKTFYSKDCIHWGLLPNVTEATKEQTKRAKGRFVGDPSHEYEIVEMKKVGEGEDATEEEETITFREEDRLSAVISDIDQDVRIVPRGSFIKTPTGEVVFNRSFEGLSVSEAAKHCSYMHFRDAELLKEKTLLQKANLDKAIDFMDIVENDVPKGSWSLQFEHGSRLVTLRSVLWLGYTFFHIPSSNKFGSIYCGNGEKNHDLPFM